MTRDRDVVRLATRSSPLARWQALRVAALLREASEGAAASGHAPIEVELVELQTTGDRTTGVPLHQIGGQGVFVKEIQAAVLDGRADAAVHSAKDLPSVPVAGLRLGAFPERADARDVLVGSTLGGLPPGALVATGAVRRRAQLANLRPDLGFCDLRGNMATRVARLGAGDVAAVVVAKAALDRLGWESLGVATAPGGGMPAEVLDTGILLPQVAQGAIAVECREDDERLAGILAAIDDAGVRRQVEAERAFLAELGGGCSLPVGAHATGGASGPLEVVGLLASLDGRVVVRHTAAVAAGCDVVAAGRDLARALLHERGGASLGEWLPVFSDPPAGPGAGPSGSRPVAP